MSAIKSDVRIKALYKKLGYDVKSSIVKAECEAIGSVLNSIVNGLDRIDLAVLAIRHENGADYVDTKKYQEAIGECVKNYEMLSKRLSENAITREEFDRVLQLVDARLGYTVNNNEIEFSPVTNSRLLALSRFVNNYVPLGITAVFGYGFTYDKWAELGFNWNYLDKLNLSFDTIDRMGVDLYE